MDAPEISRSADISPDGKYRYSLWRSWGRIAHDSKLLAYVMLNPSTADGETDDQTIRKCIHFAQRDGFHHLIVVNLYAFRSTDPSALWTMGAEDARGPLNIDHVRSAIEHADRVVLAWGNPGGPKLPPWLQQYKGNVPFWCLGTNKDNSPKHPCYLANDTPMVLWNELDR